MFGDISAELRENAANFVARRPYGGVHAMPRSPSLVLKLLIENTYIYVHSIPVNISGYRGVSSIDPETSLRVSVYIQCLYILLIPPTAMDEPN